MRRIPLWVTLIPLAAGIAGWYHVWSGYADTLAADVARLQPGAAVGIAGFPYRLEATVERPRIGFDGPGLAAGAEAEKAVINRQPWRPEHSVFNLTAPLARVAIPALPLVQASIRAPAAQASLHLVPGTARPIIARLSIVWSDAQLTTTLLPVPVRAAAFEAHLRETPTTTPTNRGPTPPRQAQLVLSGTAVRLGEGAPLTLAANLDLTANQPITSFTAWRALGTAELTSLTLADKSGEILSLTATAIPTQLPSRSREGRLGDSRAGVGASAASDTVSASPSPARGGGVSPSETEGVTTLRLAGTVTTVCPLSLRAAFAGLPAPSENRTRKPVTIALQSLLGEPPTLSPPPESETKAPRRNQLPPCPRLR
ncbi:hypothetical protein [Sandaracinobacteroides saxicola]|uniref:DUF2125 domain-containing protein n=1 Tax=Sandaracinobacteroides saxicola TaxID=2759707 RepID=A0A7G5IJP7_9SPHN|nr:hypothetical protein [Sandaracinobacteroides saxicola]QMW23589.1 hypothetical protein H3309_03585 [Sandaracinobacteroides saxicola]